MTDVERQAPQDPPEDELPPNESAPGHHPDDEDTPGEDSESEQSFPASDPPANY